MAKGLLRLTFGLALACLAPVLAELGVTGAQVAAEEGQQSQQKTRRVPSMSEATYKKLAEAQEQIDAKNLQGALRILQDMLASRRRPLNGNEIGQVHNMLGFLYFSMEDYNKAIENYQNVVLSAAREIDDAAVSVARTFEQQSILSEAVEAAERSLDRLRSHR